MMAIDGSYTTWEAAVLSGLVVTVVAFPCLVATYRLGWVWRSAEQTARRAGQLLGFGLPGAGLLVFFDVASAGGLDSLNALLPATLPVLAVSALAIWLGFNPLPYFIGRSAQERPISLAMLVCTAVWIFFATMAVLANVAPPLS